MTISQSGLTLPTRTEAEARADIAAAELRRQIAIETNRQWRQLLSMDSSDIREEAIKARAIEYANETPSNIPDIDDSDKINRMRQPYTKWQYDPEDD